MKNIFLEMRVRWWLVYNMQYTTCSILQSRQVGHPPISVMAVWLLVPRQQQSVSDRSSAQCRDLSLTVSIRKKCFHSLSGQYCHSRHNPNWSFTWEPIQLSWSSQFVPWPGKYQQSLSKAFGDCFVPWTSTWTLNQLDILPTFLIGLNSGAYVSQKNNVILFPTPQKRIGYFGTFCLFIIESCAVNMACHYNNDNSHNEMHDRLYLQPPILSTC